MSLVLDASAAIAWLYGEGNAAELNRLYEAVRDEGAIVPQIWRVEIANVLLVGYRKGKHSRSMVEEYLADLALLRIEVDAETQKQAWGEVMRLAEVHGLTSYDACYLELAVRLRVPLATLDKQLIRVASKAGVQLFGAEGSHSLRD